MSPRVELRALCHASQRQDKRCLVDLSGGQLVHDEVTQRVPLGQPEAAGSMDGESLSFCRSVPACIADTTGRTGRTAQPLRDVRRN